MSMPPAPSDLVPHVVEGATFRLVVYAGSPWAGYIIKADTIIDEKISLEAKEAMEKANPGIRHYLLVGSDGLFTVNRKARKMAALPEFSTHLAAVACYTPYQSISLLAELYNKINKPAVPTRIFSSREAAEEWLRLQMKTWQQKSPAPGGM